MDRKVALRTGAIIGTMIGSYVPLLWGGNFLSFASVFISAIGGILGVYIGFQMTK